MNRFFSFLAILCIAIANIHGQVSAEQTNTKNDKPQIQNPSKEISKPKLISDEELDKYLKEKNIGRPEPLRTETNYWQEFTQMMMVLGAILIFLITAGWFLKRMMRMRMSQVNFASTIKIIDKRALHPKACIYYIEVEGERFLVGEGQNHLSLIGQVQKSDDEEATPPTNVDVKGAKFASFLKSCVSKKGTEKVEV